MHARVVLAALTLAGCSTTSGLDATETRSGFDGARIVDIRPHGAACKELPCPSLGAQWNSKTPQLALLHVKVSGYKFSGITRVELAIDGAITRLEARGPSAFESTTPPIRDSSHSVGVPLDRLREMAAARKAWVRVHTVEGFVEAPIVDGAEDSKALHAMRRFLAAVDGAAAK